MKNLAIFGLVAASASFAAGTLWNMNVDAYQVQVPEAIACDKSADYGKLCYETTGGWWFAYAGDTKDGEVVSFDPITTNPDGTYKLITTNEEDGTIIPNGNLIEGTGLQVTMTTSGGASAAPAIAGIGFNWTKAETAIDISSHTGYCITYNWTGTDPLQMELGWNETSYGYDTWYATLPSGSNTLSFLFSSTTPANGFKKDGWDKDNANPIATALSSAVSLKIRLKNSAAAPSSGTLTISDLGWAGECTGAAISSISKSSFAKATLLGRTLSISGISSAASVEVINLQGQVVLKNSINGATSLGLKNLQQGVYMLRITGKTVSLNQKIVIQ